MYGLSYTCTPDECHLSNLSLHETDNVRSPRPGLVLTAPTAWYAAPGSRGSCLVSMLRHLAPVRCMSSSSSPSVLRLFASGPTPSSSTAARLPPSFGNIDASPHGVWLEKKWKVTPGCNVSGHERSEWFSGPQLSSASADPRTNIDGRPLRADSISWMKYRNRALRAKTWNPRVQYELSKYDWVRRFWIQAQHELCYNIIL